MTSEELARDLRDIDRLLAMLTAPCGVDDEDLDDLRWLLKRRRCLAALRAVRQTQAGKKVVDLRLWRQGADAAPGQGVRVA